MPDDWGTKQVGVVFLYTTSVLFSILSIVAFIRYTQAAHTLGSP